MYIRITRGRFDPAIYDQVLPLTQDVGAALQRLPGFQHRHTGLDRTAGVIAAVTVWDTQEHAAFSRDSLGDVVNRIQALGVQLDPPEVYEAID